MAMTSDRPIYDEFYDGYRLFVGDLSENVITTDVSKEFSKFGELIDVWVARNPPGFGFVVFANKIDCERCKRKLDGRAVFDRPLRIEFARPTPIRDNGRAPASYQAYILKLRERGIEPKFRYRARSRSPIRRGRDPRFSAPARFNSRPMLSNNARYFQRRDRSGSEERLSEYERSQERSSGRRRIVAEFVDDGYHDEPRLKESYKSAYSSADRKADRQSTSGSVSPTKKRRERSSSPERRPKSKSGTSTKPRKVDGEKKRVPPSKDDSESSYDESYSSTSEESSVDETESSVSDSESD